MASIKAIRALALASAVAPPDPELRKATVDKLSRPTTSRLSRIIILIVTKSAKRRGPLNLNGFLRFTEMLGFVWSGLILKGSSTTKR